MSDFFTEIIDAQQQTADFSKFAIYEQKIRRAFLFLRRFCRYRKITEAQFYRNFLMKECEDGQCADAIKGILAMILV